MTTLADVVAAKNAGNEQFKAKDYPAAIAAYSAGVKLLPTEPESEDEDGSSTPFPGVSSDVLKQGAVLLCNRCAAHMGVAAGDKKHALQALLDAQLAATMDPTNWKAHWRTGLALMMMVPSIQRSEQAMAAFEKTIECPTCQGQDKTNAREAYNRAKYRREQGVDALDMPDMSNCCVS